MIGDWRDRGLCTGMIETHGAERVATLFFPVRGQSARTAKAICRGCPVREECLEHALTEPEKFGVWGGTSERERRAIRRERLAEGTLTREPKPITHGTRAGYVRCLQRPEGPCGICLDASARRQTPDPGYRNEGWGSRSERRKRLADLEGEAS